MDTDKIPPDDLSTARKHVNITRQKIGPRYDAYLNKVVEALREGFPLAFQSMTDENLREFVALIEFTTDVSHGFMKRLKEACDGCGWCCSQTSHIVVSGADADRISRRLRQKREDLFMYTTTDNGKEWIIKRGHPCQWWNSKNGRCAIYNSRPQTCRNWPQTTDDEGRHGLQIRSECRYSVMVMVYRTLEALKTVETDLRGHQV
jgi:Fe-S-cluster containining protein